MSAFHAGRTYAVTGAACGIGAAVAAAPGAEGDRVIALSGGCRGRAEDLAALVAWRLSAQNRLMTGQVLFADAGIKCAARGERVR
ncbi:hypothetical protein ACO2Q3_22020 [Caulobacter sp. KR2-114]|uniref:hypothetical protein n=1 Tax=Caulobacter sp. KR2-114 TaxID=3400912 RepID=UPI003C0AD001